MRESVKGGGKIVEDSDQICNEKGDREEKEIMVK